jgi:hypothetical protein
MAVARLGWLLRPLEQDLNMLNDRFIIDANFVGASATNRLPTNDDTIAAFDGLVDIGILRHKDPAFRLAGC